MEPVLAFVNRTRTPQVRWVPRRDQRGHVLRSVCDWLAALRQWQTLAEQTSDSNL